MELVGWLVGWSVSRLVILSVAYSMDCFTLQHVDDKFVKSTYNLWENVDIFREFSRRPVGRL